VAPSALNANLLKKMDRMRRRQSDLLRALSESGHAPDVKGIFGFGGESSGSTQVWIECNRCRRKRRRWVPERWQPLSAETPCPGQAERRFLDGTPVP
jgi:hypothetical protein